MTISASLKRIFIFSILLFTTKTYSQETIIPLTEGGWVGGLSGNVSWNDFNNSASNTTNYYDSKSEGFGFSVSSKNGRFVINNLSVGFDLQWSENELSTKYKAGSEDYENTRLGFIGLWSRYYLPFIGNGWAIFSEVSIGYGNFKSITDILGNAAYLRDEISADGFAYNLGFGSTIFVSNNVAFEITGRYQGGTLKGDFYKKGFQFDDYEIKLSNIDILFGIMIYLK